MPNLNSKLNPSELKSLEKFHNENGIYVAEVMDTRSPLNNGDIKVWILNSGTNKANPINWVVAHSSQNVGITIKDNVLSTSSYTNQQTCYGSWCPLPYIGNYVFIFFPYSTETTTSPYWFGSPNGLRHDMLPGIPYDLEQNDEYKLKCDNNYKVSEYEKPKNYSILNNALSTQGLNNDRLRGISTSSSRRDIPSHCYGFLSPLGNQMIIDDGWSLGDNNIHWINDPRKNNLDNVNKDDNGQYHSKKNWIASLEESDKENKLNRFHGGFRFRTRNGTQLLILDSGNIYMINKDGTAWVELSEDGYVDCYSAFGINASSEGDINLHAKNVNIEATDKITLSSGKNIILHTSSTVDITSTNVVASTCIASPKIIASNGTISSFSSTAANITGIFAGTLQGTAYYATSAGQVPVEQPLPDVNTDTVDTPESPTYYDVEQQFDETLTSINSRVPTHEPWDGHDKNDSIPTLLVKQTVKKEEEITQEIKTNSNQVRM